MEPYQSNLPDKLLKPYNPQETEPEILQVWDDSGLANPDVCIQRGYTAPDAETFSIVLPPPNVTGTLHTGHALMLIIQDIMVRYARMQGKRTLWIPGTDHAAIATQSKVEKILEKEGLKKRDMGRDEFLGRVEQFAQESHDTIVNQCKTMGATLDWSREAFTLDDKRTTAVYTAFKQMYDDGLIYRKYRVVNWDPKGQTVISDDEIVYEERDAVLYTFKYSTDFPIAISTTRPETKVGDAAVAVHPDDVRYQQYIGQTFTVDDFCGVPLTIKIIADMGVDPEFGTGALGVTPAHSKIDWDMAIKNDLPVEPIINEFAKMTVGDDRIMGKKTTEAKEVIVGWLRDNNLMIDEQSIKQNISTAERSGGIIEPLPKLQWFIDVNKPIAKRDNKSLKQLMLDSVRSGDIEILPERFEKNYFHWIENLQDWCISRQIWYGHRIPVWYRSTTLTASQNDEVYCDVVPPTGDNWIQDEDVLDTWFSSGLWTFSTLGWPENTLDLQNYHPTQVIETGWDILAPWVARMILMSTYLLGTVPFKTVYLHGMVRAADGQKMSKSLGNAATDPLDLIAKYGNDALRMAMIIGNTPGNDLKLNENDIRGYGKFANKIWNASRFVLEKISDLDTSSLSFPGEGWGEVVKLLDDEDRKSVNELHEMMAIVTREMNEYKFSLAGEKLYHYFWHTFADIIIERSKTKILENASPESVLSAQWVLHIHLTTLLRALHPFMPFVTEELWKHVGTVLSKNKDLEKQHKLLIIESWPE
jgi:valyl-tRNA synthetase